MWLVVIGVPLQLASGLYCSAAVYLVFAGLMVHGRRIWNRAAQRVRGRIPETSG